MPKRTGDFDAWMLGELTDPQLAASYVNAAISEDPNTLKVALRNVAKAYTMKKVAEEVGVARESLYTSLSEAGNPTLANLNGILKAVGLKIAVTPDSEKSNKQEPTPVLVVADRLPIDSGERKAIDGLTRAAKISVTIPRIDRFLGGEPQPGIGYTSFKTQAGLGENASEPLILRTVLSGYGNTFEAEMKDHSGVANSNNAAFVLVGPYAGQNACPVGSKSLQPER